MSVDTLPGSCVIVVRVTDGIDLGRAVTYRRLDRGGGGQLAADVFHVGSRNGRVCTRSWLPADSPTVVRLAVLATERSVYDWSSVSDSPTRSVAVAVELKITAGVQAPCQQIFETGFYSANVDEDVPVGHCFLTVSIVISSTCRYGLWELQPS